MSASEGFAHQHRSARPTDRKATAAAEAEAERTAAHREGANRTTRTLSRCPKRNEKSPDRGSAGNADAFSAGSLLLESFTVADDQLDPHTPIYARPPGDHNGRGGPKSHLPVLVCTDQRQDCRRNREHHHYTQRSGTEQVDPWWPSTELTPARGVRRGSRRAVGPFHQPAAHRSGAHARAPPGLTSRTAERGITPPSYASHNR